MNYDEEYKKIMSRLPIWRRIWHTFFKPYIEDPKTGRIYTNNHQFILPVEKSKDL
jgi:hypothetical protein